MAKEKKKSGEDSAKESSTSENSTPPKTEGKQPGSEVKRLYRSLTNRMVGGVCGGIAEYLGIDPTIVRILFVIAVLPWGIGIIAYIIGWIVIPENKKEPGEAHIPAKTPVFGVIVGAALILIGLGMIFRRMSYWFWMPDWIHPFFSFESFVALLLIVCGIFFIAHTFRKNGEKGFSPPGSSAGQHFLYRSRTDKKLSGVCGGIGEYFGIDPTIVRIAWVLITIVTHIFLGLVLYVIMAFIVPEAPAVRKDSS